MVKQIKETIARNLAADYMAGAGDELPAAGPIGTGLESIAQEADQLQLGEQDAAGQVDQVPALTNGKCIEGALIMLRDVFCAFTGFKSPKENFTDAAAAAMGEAWGKVADKYGVDLGAIAGDYGPEIAAVLVTAPVAIAVIQGMKVEIAEREKKKPIEATTTTAAPGPEEGADGAAPERPKIVSTFPRAH